MNMKGLKIGFAGLGAMGSGMSRHLPATGFDVVVYDVDPGAFARAEAAGCRDARSVRELRQAET